MSLLLLKYLDDDDILIVLETSKVDKINGKWKELVRELLEGGV